MNSTETDLDLGLASIQHLAITARKTIKELATFGSSLLIVEAANILEDIERLESAYIGEKFLRDLEAEYLNRSKANAE